jgi:hypothetical protein
MSGLMARARKDIERFTTDARGFAVPILFSVTDGVFVKTATCNGLAIKTSIAVDETTGDIRNGIIANGLNIRISVSETALAALDYPVRNTNNDANLVGHTVTFSDVTGVQATYVIREQYPDSSLGLIVCGLGMYGAVTPPGRLIIGWMPAMINVVVVDTVDDDVKQTLDNGDIINLQYVLNNDGTLTIPYLAGYNVLTPFMMDNINIQDEPYDKTTGTFDGSAHGGYLTGNLITINAVIPIWQPS